ALRLLRAGDYRGVLVHATAGESSIAHAPAIIVCAGTYWRNSWKYRTRTYRHFGWDNGTILANMLAMAAALRLPAKIVLGFIDSEVNALLDLDTSREVAFSVVSLGQIKNKSSAAPRDLPKLNFPTIPLSKSEVDYPELREMHQASSLQTPEEVAEWRTGALSRSDAAATQTGRVKISGSTDTIEQVILRRASTRKFEPQPITLDQLLTILTTSTQPVWPGFSLLNDLYLIINAVDGLASGDYYYHAAAADLQLLKPGNFRNEARYLGLQQDLPGDAAAGVFFLADLNAILDVLG